MITLDAQKFFSPPEGRHTIPLSRVSRVAFIYSSNVPVALQLVNPDGELVPCGTLPPSVLEWHKLELRNYHGLRFEAEPSKGKAERVFCLSTEVDHRVGEPISDIPMSHAVQTPQQLSEKERTRRTVLQTLETLKVMPSEDQLSVLEAELGFDFESEEFGTYLEPDWDPVDDDVEPVVPPAPPPNPAPEPDPSPDEPQ